MAENAKAERAQTPAPKTTEASKPKVETGGAKPEAIKKAKTVAKKNPGKFGKRIDLKGAAVAPTEKKAIEAQRDKLVAEAGLEEGEEAESQTKELNKLNPKVAKRLESRGVKFEGKDKLIGDKKESEILADFLDKNPDVNAKKLYEAMGLLDKGLGGYKGMTMDEAKEMARTMTPEEYQKFLETTAESLSKIANKENKTGEAADATRTSEDGGTEKNDFALSSIGKSSGVSGGSSWRPSSISGGVSGTFEAPEVSNAELVSAVEGLAGRLSPPADPAALKAVVAVESGGKMNATRYEPHHGNKGRDEATSFGAFQIMGFNAKSLGYSSATAMKEKFISGGVDEQVNAFGKFLETRGLTPHIADGKQPDFRSFAHGYNGAAYAKLNYHGKMKAAYDKYKSKSSSGAMV